MKITFVISSLSSGGSERVMSIMANYWADAGWEIIILTLDDGTSSPFYDLDPRIRHLPLAVAGHSANPAAGVRNNIKRIRKLRAVTQLINPDVVISFIDKVNILTLLGIHALNIPVLVSERTDPAMYSIGFVWEALRRWTYPKSAGIITQTARAQLYFSKKIRDKISVIPNPVTVPSHHTTSFQIRLVNPSVVAMGRLVRDKGFDLLLHAFARIKDRHPDWTLTIMGEGPLRSELQSLSASLDLVDRVYFPGSVKNPEHVLKQAALFIMSSRFEGFPNSLCEAMACGLPVISFDCASGPREIVRDGIDGLLVQAEDVDALADAMSRLMTDDAERKLLAVKALDVIERFNVKKIMKIWEELIFKVTEIR